MNKAGLNPRQEAKGAAIEVYRVFEKDFQEFKKQFPIITALQVSGKHLNLISSPRTTKKFTDNEKSTERFFLPISTFFCIFCTHFDSPGKKSLRIKSPSVKKNLNILGFGTAKKNETNDTTDQDSNRDIVISGPTDLVCHTNHQASSNPPTPSSNAPRSLANSTPPSSATGIILSFSLAYLFFSSNIKLIFL